MPRASHSDTHQGLRAVWERVLAALAAGETPDIEPREIPCFAPSVLRGDPWIGPESLAPLLSALTAADIPVFQRALQAMEANEEAWLGFKVVTDPVAAMEGEGGGSADPLPAIFLVSNASGTREGAEILCGRPFSDRDRRQMLDITRGPQMHGEQFAGLSWKSLPLFRPLRVFLLGAGTVAVEVAQLADRVGFETVVVDCEARYLGAVRFPHSRRVLVEDFDSLSELGIRPEDFVCVLTRGHMHDPQALIHGIRAGAEYVGMMGRTAKNARIFGLAEVAGIDPSALDAIHAPIGLKFGAKSPAELAVSIVAELIQVRSEQRKKAKVG